MSLPNMQELIEQELLSHYASMYRLAYTYVKNEADAMDIVQESAYLAIKNASTVRNPDYIRTWIFRIVIKTALSQHEISAEKIVEQGESDQYTDFDTIEALNVLNSKERAVIILRYFEDCRLQDIADAMKENLSTVKSILYRSLKKLRVELTEGDDCYER